MTYKEFMKTFNEYKQLRIDIALNEYGSMRQAAEAIGVSPSSITRLVQGKFKNNHRVISKLIGEDIENIDIKSAKEFQIEYLERKLKELKGE